jgi:MYXO-CTERM domain-containing protein
VVVEGCELFSVADSSAWTADQWINAASSGIFVRGTSITVRDNSLTNVRFGISVDGASALIEKNRIVNFSADGMRGLGDDGVFQYNLVKNVYASDADGDTNHDDGFQSWSVGAGGVGTGVVKGVVLRGNVFLNREDPSQKFPNSMQGIGCFDGFFEGWVVENNVVMTDHWHGISFYGMRNSRIVNNTVIDINDVSPGPPWIKVTAHKDGTASDGILVRNNLATDFQLEGTNLTQDHNTTLATTDLAAYFVAPTTFDLHLLPGAPAVDTGSADQAPPTDLEGIARPQGKGVDLGAYEWHEPTVTPVDGGTGGSGGGSGGTGGGSTGGASGGSGGQGGSGQPAAKGGCGCRVEERGTGSAAWALVALGLGLGWRRRARRG